MTMPMMPDMDSMILMEKNPCDHVMIYNDSTRQIAAEFSKASEFVIQPVIFSVGILTNTLSLIVLSGVRMNKVFRICLQALALSDLGCTLIGLTQIFVEIFFYCGQVPEGYMLKPVMANNTLYMLYLYFVSTSASLVVFIAFIRNIMYLKPLRARAYFTKTIVKILCGLIFFVTFLIYVPTTIYVMWLSCFKETSNEYCHHLNATIPNLKPISNGYIYFVSALYGPFMFLVYIANFVCIRVSLTRSAASVSQMTSHGRDHQRSDTVTRITKTLSVILILDVICTLPTLVQSIGVLLEPEDTHEKKNVFFELIDVVAEIFLALRPTYNFWLYIYQRPEFRYRLKCIIYKIFYPCCVSSSCPTCGMFNETKLKNESLQLGSSSDNLSKRNANEVTVTTRLTPPAGHVNKPL